MDDREKLASTFMRYGNYAGKCQSSLPISMPNGDIMELDLLLFLKGFSFGMFHAAAVCDGKIPCEIESKAVVEHAIGCIAKGGGKRLREYIAKHVTEPTGDIKELASAFEDLEVTTNCDEREL